MILTGRVTEKEVEDEAPLGSVMEHLGFPKEQFRLVLGEGLTPGPGRAHDIFRPRA